MISKFRHEYKYLVSNEEIAIIENRIKKYMQKDMHVNDKEYYSIKSLYFDDYFNTNLYDNINGIDPREKFRIRLYNNDTSRISLECKKKENGKTQKVVEVISKEQCEYIINNGYIKNIDSQSKLLKKLTLCMMKDGLKPMTIVQYDRVPYIFKHGNVRVTFDKNLSSSNEIKSFLESNYPKRPVMPTNINLMEVKWDEFIPDEIYELLSIDNLQQTAYSKYYLCRKYAINYKGE